MRQIDTENANSQLKLLDIHRRTLGYYLEQMSLLGTAYSPPTLQRGVIELRDSIREIKESLRDRGYEVEDLDEDQL
jgi:hypothetical protein